MIATMEGKSYSDSLELIGIQYRPELVILNSPEDGKKLKIPFTGETALQGRQKTYYAVIVAPSSGEVHQAVEVIVADLHEELQKAAPPISEVKH